MPVGPPGTVTVIAVPGGRVPEDSKPRVSGPLLTQEPGTAGVSVGMGLWSDRAVVKRTLTAASRGTLVAPGAGSVDMMSSGALLRTVAGVAVALAALGFTLATTSAADAPARRHTTMTMATIIPVGRESRLRCRGTSGM